MLFKRMAWAVLALFASCGASYALPVAWQMGFQAPVTPVMRDIEDFHRLLLYIIIAISIFVLTLLLWIAVRYNEKRNPVPSKITHHTLLEVAWTIIPVIILVVIAIPSFRLLYFEADVPNPDLTIKAIGKQWSWTYEYPGAGKNFQFDSFGLSDLQDTQRGEPRLLGVDNPIVVPVNKVVEVQTTGADVIHSWAMPQFGVKMDAVPGRINTTWFKATQIGTYYGECSELCGVHHAFMPIEVRVVSQPDYDRWIAGAKKKFAAIDPVNDAPRMAALAK